MSRFFRRCCCCIATVALAFPALSVQADIIDVGIHETVYNGFSRGFSYISPVDHVITQLEVPVDNFAAGDLASFMVEVDDVVQLYEIGNSAGLTTSSILVLAGQEVLILGNWTTGVPGGFTAKNSYNGTSPYSTSILGNAVDLFRAGYQSDIGDGTYTGGAGFTGLSGSHGRIFVTAFAPVPEPVSLGLLGIGGLGLVFTRRRR